MRGATLDREIARYEHEFQSTLPMRGATRKSTSPGISPGFQSTLPMRGATSMRMCVHLRAQLFQSTLPMRGATAAAGARLAPALISIHAPHAGSDDLGNRICRSGRMISIHAPHAGSDQMRGLLLREHGQFQSTLPMRGATKSLARRGTILDISIHAPHAGSDLRHTFCTRLCERISIHAPHAGSD